MPFRTNIKNLPEGTYFSEVGYSQKYPWVVIKETTNTKTLARVEVTADPDWQPDFLIGGFAGHCVNQDGQTWVFANVNSEVTRVVRMTKRGVWSHKGVRFVEDRAYYFYDYNF